MYGIDIPAIKQCGISAPEGGMDISQTCPKHIADNAAPAPLKGAHIPG